MDTNHVEPTDAEIEALVSEAIAAEAAIARTEAAPPSSAIVWWRAQMRARQEAAQIADRPITIVHGLAIASGAGLMMGLLGYATGGLTGALAWLAATYQAVAAGAPLTAIDFTSRWVTLPMTAMLVSVLVASVAAYVILADE
jgi:hypothetical protein